MLYGHGDDFYNAKNEVKINFSSNVWHGANLGKLKEHLIEHLISFANHPNNGYLVSVDQEQVEGIIARLTNIGRDECCRSNFSS